MVCDRCFQPLEHGEHGVWVCPLERQDRAPVVRPDSIPGGLLIEHGLCHPDGTPRRFDSHTEIRAAEQAAGLQKWSDHFEESGTKNGRDYLEYRKSGAYARLKRDRAEQRAERRR